MKGGVPLVKGIVAEPAADSPGGNPRDREFGAKEQRHPRIAAARFT